jgi:tRNA threonylcarbamoyladenosine modification (KEOPS) complex  Pcc1 subunit
MMTAEILLEYPSTKFAKSVLDALYPDNREEKDQSNRISTHLRGRTLHVTILNCPRVETMQASLQDIFRCVKAAEQSISLVERSRSKKAGPRYRNRKKDKRFK